MAIWRLASEDGNVLLFNIHVSARGEKPILFPSDDLDLPDDYARRLFSMSSRLPPPMLRQAGVLEARCWKAPADSPSMPIWPP